MKNIVLTIFALFAVAVVMALATLPTGQIDSRAAQAEYINRLRFADEACAAYRDHPSVCASARRYAEEAR
jgi:hypothetical protein